MSGYGDYSDELLSRFTPHPSEILEITDFDHIKPEWAHKINSITQEDVIINDLTWDPDLNNLTTCRPSSGILETIWVPKQETSGDFVMWWDGDTVKGVNHAVNSGEYIVGRLKDHTLLTREYNCHPESSQIIFPYQNDPYLMLLGRGRGSNLQLKLLHVKGGEGVHIMPGTWHQPPIPLTPRQVFQDRQSLCHLCIVKDNIEEKQQWLGIPFGNFLPIDKTNHG